ncbi:MAG: glycosyltransferase family 2 protein [Oscillospiraceae bacterium]|jgi:glycosyltransferase involved in cell wall biosynthesis|nr:glycosyltransferase family 2 protein [Oscillospiraceae bacterium]
MEVRFKKPTIDLVVPCYNEEDGLTHFVEETNKIISTLPGYDFNYILINDGSKDKTYLVIKNLASTYSNIKYISLSRNFGKEAAMYAGLRNTTGDYVIVMDSDLQHPPSLFPQFLEAMQEGYDCCQCMRSSRVGESKIHSAFSRTFYRLSNKITDVKMPHGAVDYRIMRRQVVDSILELCEVQRFTKGIFSWVGFNTKWIPYENVAREIGATKWSFWGLFKYAIDGITAFSVAPLRFIAFLGFTISSLAFLYMLVVIIQTLIFGKDLPGYATTISISLFIGGITEFSIGILGEYIGRIYMEAKDRPVYICSKTNIEDFKTAKAPLNTQEATPAKED